MTLRIKYIIIERKYLDWINHFNFYIRLLLFINSNFNLSENEINLEERKIVFGNIISIIYKLEFLSTNSIEFIPYISSLINILFIILEFIVYLMLILLIL